MLAKRVLFRTVTERKMELNKGVSTYHIITHKARGGGGSDTIATLLLLRGSFVWR